MKIKNRIPKWARVTATVVLSVIAFIALAFFGVRVYFMTPVNNYYSASEKAFKIPGLNDNFVPQGFSYDEEQNRYLISGYFSDKTASAVYLVDGESGESKQVRLSYKGGNPMRGHSGGVAFYKDFVYVAGSSQNCIYVYSYSEMVSANDGQQVKALGEFSLSNPNSENDYVTASALSVYEDKIIINEFHYEPDYALLDSHEITTSAGDQHGGIAIEYRLSDSEEFGINPKPVCAYTVRDKVQGMTFYLNKVYCSTSYGLKKSEIYEYSRNLLKHDGDITLLGYEIPLYALDSSCLNKVYTVPPMAEGMVFVDGKLLIMSEFACNKYILGKFTAANWCYATDLSKM